MVHYLLTMNKHPLHFDQEYAPGHSEFGRCIVASPFTVGVAGRHERQRRQPEGDRQPRLDQHEAPRIRSIPGDTLYAESEVLGKRESKSRPDAGIVPVRTIGKNQDGEVVCTFDRTMLVQRRSHALEEKANY